VSNATVRQIIIDDVSVWQTLTELKHGEAEAAKK
jgi:hypothetical protein